MIRGASFHNAVSLTVNASPLGVDIDSPCQVAYCYDEATGSSTGHSAPGEAGRC